MIGYYIKLNPDLFIRAFDELNQDIAVHTWSHRHMTTLSNIDIVSEFGWTMEIIKNSTVSVISRSRSPDGPLTAVIPRVVDYRGTGDPHMATPITV